jgi:Amt family ammonium transporter
LLPQIIGIFAVGTLSFLAAFGLFHALKATIGIRVTMEEEIRGLDIGEHGMEAYTGFQIFNSQ